MKEEIKQRIKLIKNGQVPQGYKKTKVGIVPEDWEIEKYSKYLKICSGKDQKEVIEENGKFFILGTGGILGKTNKFLYDKPSVLIGRKGTINKPQYMEIPFWTVDTLFYSKLFQNVFPKYIFYNFSMVNWLKYNEGTSVPSLNSNTIENIKTSLPPLAEQQKIADILTTQDKIIELKQKLIEEKEKQKKYLMQNLLTGKIRLKGFKDKWEKVTISKIGETFNGLINKTKSNFGNGDDYYITYKNIFDNYIIDKNKLEKVIILKGEKQNKVCYGDILFTTSSEIPNEVGICSIFLEELKNIYLNSFCFGFRVKNKKDINLLFLLYYFRSNIFRRKVIKLAQGSTRFNLSKSELIKIKISLPPLEEQDAIAQILSKADEEIELLQKELEQEKQKKKALMQLLLTGIVRV